MMHEHIGATQSSHSQRRSIRLKDYDYAQAGAYFVTICTHRRELYFEEDAMRRCAEDCWIAIPEHMPSVELDAWVVMPNHLHGVLVITESVGGRDLQLNAPTKRPNPLRDVANRASVISPRRGTLGVIVRTYKAAVTTCCRKGGYADFGWQRNYYEHVIRNERELHAVRQYIADNPAQWELDRDNPANTQQAPNTIAPYLQDAGIW